MPSKVFEIKYNYIKIPKHGGQSDVQDYVLDNKDKDYVGLLG